MVRGNLHRHGVRRVVVAVIAAGVLLDGGSASAYSDCNANQIDDALELSVFEEESQLYSDTQEDDFGLACAIDGDVAVVGAPSDDHVGNTAGAAYVFRRVNGAWVNEQKLIAGDAHGSEQFGFCVAISGDVLIVGAPFDSDIAIWGGSAYVFRWNGAAWLEDQKLTPSDAENWDEFGRAVAIHGDTAIVGAPWDDDLGTDSGSAYVFVWNGSTWVEAQKLNDPEGAAFDAFGFSAGMHAGRAVVGALFDSVDGGGDGSATVFEQADGVWTQAAKLAAEDGAYGDQFGMSVAMNGDLVAVGAPGSDPLADEDDTGAIYIFRRVDQAWVRDGKVFVPNAYEGDRLGTRVAIHGDIALGAIDPYSLDLSTFAMAFRRSDGEWAYAQRLGSETYDGDPQLGAGLAVFADMALVGVASTNVRVFQSEPNNNDCNTNLRPDDCDPDCNTNDAPDDCDAGFGTSQDCDSNSLADECDIDCNTNDLVDDCETSNGTTVDCNTNTQPDICDSVYSEVLEKLLASDGSQIDGFGWSVAIDGPWAFVGAPVANDSDGTGLPGAVYVFRQVGGAWSEYQKLYAADGAHLDHFGFSVDVLGDVAIVGATYAGDAGSAYVFRLVGSEWGEEQKLTASDGAVDDGFGWRVAIAEEVAVVGTPLHDGAGLYSGAVYVFRRDAGVWAQEQKLLPSAGIERQYLGSSVDVRGDVIMASAPGEHELSQSGTLYVIRRVDGAWIEEQKLYAEDADREGAFGTAVSLSGGRVLIGDGYDGSHGMDAGSAYVFALDGGSWVQEAKLVASDAGDDAHFGLSVSLDHATAVVGAYGAANQYEFQGGAYVFHMRGGGEWAEALKLASPDSAAGDHTGFAVSVSDGVALIGAYSDDDLGSGAGSAYVFPAGDTDCDGNGVPNVCESVPSVLAFVDALLGDGGDSLVECLADINRDGRADGDDIGEYLERIWQP